MSKFHVSISYTLREICRQGALRSGRAGPRQFIILNDSASPKMVMKVYFILFQFFFLQVLEMFECRRGKPYMPANRNFVRFFHS